MPRGVFARHRTPPEIRFMSQVIPEPNSGCWLWLGHAMKGYYGSLRGRFWVDYDPGQILAHRASYLMFKGKIPEGVLVLHKCDVSLCVNPDHLYLGNHSDNVKDMVDRGRAFFQRHPTQCASALEKGRQFNFGHQRTRGEKNPKARLSWDQVREIRIDSRSAVKLSPIYGVSMTAIYNIRRGKTWKEKT